MIEMADAGLQQRLIEILEQRDAQARLERTLEPEWAMVAALYELIHKKSAGVLFVGELAEVANRRLAEQGETRLLTARAGGAILKSFDLKTRLLGSWGRGFHITLSLRRRIHQLARSFGITRYDITNWMAAKAGNAGPPCALCTEFDLFGGLRCVPLDGKGRTAARSRLGPWEQKDGTSNQGAAADSANGDSDPSPGSSEP